MRPWTLKELHVLRAYSNLGRDALAALLDRTPDSVKWAAATHHISLVTTDDDIDVDAQLARLIQGVRDTPGLAICPMCGKRLVRMRTGMCRACHLDALLQLHSERLDEQLRLQRLDKSRQDKRRLRVCERCGEPFFPRPSSTRTKCEDCAP